MEIENFNWGVLFIGVGQLLLVYIVFNLGSKCRYLMDEIICLRKDLLWSAKELGSLNKRIYKLDIDNYRLSVKIPVVDV